MNSEMFFEYNNYYNFDNNNETLYNIANYSLKATYIIFIFLLHLNIIYANY